MKSRVKAASYKWNLCLDKLFCLGFGVHYGAAFRCSVSHGNQPPAARLLLLKRRGSETTGGFPHIVLQAPSDWVRWLRTNSCAYCVVLCFFFLSAPPAEIPGGKWTRRGLMLRAVPCLFSERWRERRTAARHRQLAGPWLAGACCCRGLCRHSEGRGEEGEELL